MTTFTLFHVLASMVALKGLFDEGGAMHSLRSSENGLVPISRQVFSDGGTSQALLFP
jgi:hypothetical protein